MSYENQIRLLENELKQLENRTENKDPFRMAQIINELRRLRKEQYEENQRVNFDDR